MKKLLIILVLIGCLFGGYYVVNNCSKDDEVSKENDVLKDAAPKKIELFEKYYSEALKIMESMTLEEKVGQLFLVRYNSDSALNEIKTYFPGGYILFAKDFQYHTKESISDEILGLQTASKVPLVIAVDEEGGYVTRVSKFSNFRSENFDFPRIIYDRGGYDLLEQSEREKANLLLSIGVNLNLAPVADISINPNDFIYDRSFGRDAFQTSVFITKMVGYANSEGISSSLKHFPGYGNNVDTHTGVAIDNRTYENFINNDFLPFQSGIEALVPTIMISHNIVNCIDSNYPASLSEKVILELRNTLNFSGIVITDDLAMGAVKSYTSDGRAATLAVKAGNNLIITSDFVNMYNEVLNAVKTSEISMDRVNDSVKRIIAWKIAYNM